MPTYDYKCFNEECNHEFEIRQGIKEDTLKKCPKCKKEKLERLITCSNFSIKGIGVYKNGTY